MQFFLDVVLLLGIIGASMLTGAYFAARGFEKGMLSLMENIKNDEHVKVIATEEVQGHATKEN